MEMSWENVLQDWQASEEEAWRLVYAERGFATWREWRESYVHDLRLDTREWSEELVVDPHRVVPGYAIGGYKGWKRYRPARKDVATYADIVRPPVPGEPSYAGEDREDVRTNGKVFALIGELRDATILALRCGDLTVVLDGSHRCAAIAIEAVDDRRSAFTLRVRSAAFAPEERTLLEEFCKDRELVVKK